MMKSFDFQEPQLPRRSRVRYWLRRVQYEISVYRPQRRESLPVKIVVSAAIVLVVAAILFPGFAVAPGGSRSSCQSNLRQIGTLTLQYAEDYDEHLPLANAWMDQTYPYTQPRSYDQVRSSTPPNSYIKNERIYRCPTLVREEREGYGYAYNRLLDGTQTSELSQESTTPLCYDSSLPGRNANALGRTGLAIPPRHTHRNIMAFLDGHVCPVDVWGRVVPSVPQ